MTRLDEIRATHERLSDPCSEGWRPHELLYSLEKAHLHRRWLLEQVDRLREALRDCAEAYHQTGSLRSHADPNDRTGWNLHGIETCEDDFCVEALAALAALETDE